MILTMRLALAALNLLDEVAKATDQDEAYVARAGDLEPLQALSAGGYVILGDDDAWTITEAGRDLRDLAVRG